MCARKSSSSLLSTSLRLRSSLFRTQTLADQQTETASRSQVESALFSQLISYAWKRTYLHRCIFCTAEAIHNYVVHSKFYTCSWDYWAGFHWLDRELLGGLQRALIFLRRLYPVTRTSRVVWTVLISRACHHVSVSVVRESRFLRKHRNHLSYRGLCELTSVSWTPHQSSEIHLVRVSCLRSFYSEFVGQAIVAWLNRNWREEYQRWGWEDAPEYQRALEYPPEC